MWLAILTMLHMTLMGCLGHKTSTQTKLEKYFYILAEKRALSGVMSVCTQLGSTYICYFILRPDTSIENMFSAIYSEDYDHDAHTCSLVRVCADCARKI